VRPAYALKTILVTDGLEDWLLERGRRKGRLWSKQERWLLVRSVLWCCNLLHCANM